MVGHSECWFGDRDLMDYREKLWRYVEKRRGLLLGVPYAWGWKRATIPGRILPHTLMVGEGTSVLWGEAIDLDCPVTMDGDHIWIRRNRIRRKTGSAGKSETRPDRDKMLHYNTLPNTDAPAISRFTTRPLGQAHATALKPTLSTRRASVKRFGPYRC